MQRPGGNWYVTPFFECFGCTVMFRDPVSFSGMCIRPNVDTSQMIPGATLGVSATAKRDNERRSKQRKSRVGEIRTCQANRASIADTRHFSLRRMNVRPRLCRRSGRNKRANDRLSRGALRAADLGQAITPL